MPRTGDKKPKTAKPWDRKNPYKGTSKTKMTDAEKAEARERAEKAGRPYPNLIDNMAVIRKRKEETGLF